MADRSVYDVTALPRRRSARHDGPVGDDNIELGLEQEFQVASERAIHECPEPPMLPLLRHPEPEMLAAARGGGGSSWRRGGPGS